jgi:SPP1 family predicted phage head-tail adaptor
MRAGQLRQQVTIQSSTQAQASTGALTTTWSDFATGIWAAVEPISGREFFGSQQVQSSVSTRIRIRHLAGVTEKMRVKHVDRDAITNYYDIEAVVPINERGAEIHLMCSWRGSEGFRG